MRNIAFAALAALALLWCQTAGAKSSRPRFKPIVEMTNGELWHAGFRHAAEQELVCGGMDRVAAKRLLNSRFTRQEERIEAVLGQKQNPEIILTLPPCSHFSGAQGRYRQSLRELAKRLVI